VNSQPDGQLIESKLANALYRNARSNPTFVSLMRYLTFGLQDGSFNWIRRKYNGLWVGGTISLYTDRLEFVPNDLNRSVHEPLVNVAVPLSAIASVARRFGVVTGIVDVVYGTECFTFRCFNAKRFTEIIRQNLVRSV
jgi:hypothetical protein